MILFNNKDIVIDGRPLFFKSSFQKGIVSIQDILRENGKFLSFQEFREKYNIECNFLHYFQVVSAIPKYLLEKAEKTNLLKESFLANATTFQLSPTVLTDLVKMKNKDYYWLFFSRKTLSK